MEKMQYVNTRQGYVRQSWSILVNEYYIMESILKWLDPPTILKYYHAQMEVTHYREGPLKDHSGW